MSRSILIVDDDPDVRESLAGALGKDGTSIRAAENATRALGMLVPAPDVILLDVRMPDMSGLELLPLLRERLPSADVVLMTAFDDMTTVVGAMRHGASDFLVKPLDLHELRRMLARVFQDRRTRAAARGACTAPYIHDGSLRTLEHVIDFYDRGGHANAYLDGEIQPLRLDAEEKRSLVALLSALGGDCRRVRPIDSRTPR